MRRFTPLSCLYGEYEASRETQEESTHQPLESSCVINCWFILNKTKKERMRVVV